MTMKVNKIYHNLQKHNLTIAFDTNVTAYRGFLHLCDDINLINSLRKNAKIAQHIVLCVSAVAHTESLFHLGQRRRSTYSVKIARHALQERNVQIFPFIDTDAERCVELLLNRYKTPIQWYIAKKQRCLECIGLPIDYDVAGTGKKCGAPNDWLIIAQASQSHTILVTEDKGRSGEFDLVENIARYEDMRQAVKQILDGLITH